MHSPRPATASSSRPTTPRGRPASRNSVLDAATGPHAELAKKKVAFTEQKLILKRELGSGPWIRSDWFRAKLAQIDPQWDIDLRQRLHPFERDGYIHVPSFLGAFTFDLKRAAPDIVLPPAFVLPERPPAGSSRPSSPRPSAPASPRAAAPVVAPRSPRPHSAPLTPRRAGPSDGQTGAAVAPTAATAAAGDGKAPSAQGAEAAPVARAAPPPPPAGEQAMPGSPRSRPGTPVPTAPATSAAAAAAATGVAADPSVSAASTAQQSLPHVELNVAAVPATVFLAADDLKKVQRVVSVLDEQQQGVVHSEDLREALEHVKVACGSGAALTALLQGDGLVDTAALIAACEKLVRAGDSPGAQSSGSGAQASTDETSPAAPGSHMRSSRAKKVLRALRDAEEEAKREARGPELDKEMVDLAFRLREKVRQHRNLREAFAKFDTDHSGAIDRDEFHAFCRSYHWTHPKSVVDALFDFMDTEGRGKLEFDVFAQAVTENKTLNSIPNPGESSGKYIFYGPKGVINDNYPIKHRSIGKACIPNLAALGGVDIVPRFLGPVEQLREALKLKIYEKSGLLQKTFRFFDKDHSGFLDREEFHAAVRSYHFAVSDETIDELFRLCDSDGSGLVSYQEFADYLMFENEEKRPYVLSEEEMKRKYVILEDCIMYSDVKPKPKPERVGGDTFEPPAPPRTDVARQVREGIDEQHETRWDRLLRDCHWLDPHGSGLIATSEFERRLALFYDIGPDTPWIHAIIAAHSANDLTRYAPVIAALREKVERDGLHDYAEPLGRSRMRPPYGVHDDIRVGRQQVAARAVSHYDRLFEHFRKADRQQSGTLPPADFDCALQQLDSGLTAGELQEVRLRARSFAAPGGDIDYVAFLKAEARPHGLLPPFSLRRSYRGAGDPIGWTSPPTTLDRDKLLLFRGQMVLNDNVPPSPRAGSPQPPPELTLPLTPPPPDERELSMDEARVRATNPLLIRSVLGSPRPPCSPLPSDRDPSFSYGVKSLPRENLRLVLANAYGTEWIQQQRSESLRRRLQERALRSAKDRAHTRTTELRLRETQRRMAFLEEARNSPLGSPFPRTVEADRRAPGGPPVGPAPRPAPPPPHDPRARAPSHHRAAPAAHQRHRRRLHRARSEHRPRGSAF